MNVPAVIFTSDASGAAESARLGYIVMIVDIIDMSTTAEALMDAGACEVYGSAPDKAAPPVDVNPYQIGKKAGERAVYLNTGIVLVAEPRTGSEEDRKKNITRVMSGIEEAGAAAETVLPNLGAETPRLFDVQGKIVVAATGTGGVAFDAAFIAGAPAVITGTVARTLHKKRKKPAEDSAERALILAKKLNRGIAVVAASKNSLEDVLAAEYITGLILEKW